MEDILLVIFLRIVVGTRSRSQDELNDWDSKLVILGRVAGVEDERQGGVRVMSSGQDGLWISLKVEVNF